MKTQTRYIINMQDQSLTSLFHLDHTQLFTKKIHAYEQI